MCPSSRMVPPAGYGLVDDIAYLSCELPLFFSLVSTKTVWILESVVTAVENMKMLYKNVHFIVFHSDNLIERSII